MPDGRRIELQACRASNRKIPLSVALAIATAYERERRMPAIPHSAGLCAAKHQWFILDSAAFRMDSAKHLIAFGMKTPAK
jgi:hypothetical protein